MYAIMLLNILVVSSPDWQKLERNAFIMQYADLITKLPSKPQFLLGKSKPRSVVIATVASTARKPDALSDCVLKTNSQFNELHKLHV